MGQAQTRIAREHEESAPTQGPARGRGPGRGNGDRQDSMRSQGQLGKVPTVSGGSPLPFREELEASFGQDLGFIKLVTGPEATESCQAIGANAYAMGNRIICAEASPSLETIAHEVAHILQQGGKGGGGKVGGANASPEREAESAAAKVAGGGKVGPLTPDGTGEVRREVSWYEELWWGLSHWDEVREGHRTLDRLKKEQEAEDKLRWLAIICKEVAGDVLSKAHSSSEEYVSFERLPWLLRTVAGMREIYKHGETLSDLLEVLTGVDDAEAAWAELRADPTSRDAQNGVCDEMGELLPAVGRVLGHLLPPGASHVVGLLKQCDGGFFRGMIRLLDATPDHWRAKGWCDDTSTASEAMCGKDSNEFPRGAQQTLEQGGGFPSKKRKR